MSAPRVIALSGGVGGAKLALGLYRVAVPDELMIVVNTGDDFDHLGLRICPDLDTLTYTLSGLADPERGWGRRDESWNFMAALDELDGETWFNLGDRDLALHVERSRRLAAGESLSAVTAAVNERLGIRCRILPMSDDAVATVVETPDGPLAFQHYFVRERCAPAVTGFRFEGAAEATPHPDFVAALRAPELEAVVVTPSNPFVSVDPILSLAGVRDAIAESAAPVVAVSPIVGGQAIKGPAAKMFAELGLPASALEVARHYGSLVDGLVIDSADADQAGAIAALGPRVAVTNTVMRDLADREALAREVLRLAAALRQDG